MRMSVVVLVLLVLASASLGQDVVEPRSGVTFPLKTPGGEMSLLAVGLRTMSFLKVKAFALGLYVSDDALRGPLAAYKGKVGTPAFYQDLIGSDFEKQLTVKYLHGGSAAQIRNWLRKRLTEADSSQVETLVGYFGDIKVGQETVYRWVPGGILEVTVAGDARPPIADQAFAAAVFSIYIGEKSIPGDMKRDLVARAADLIP